MYCKICTTAKKSNELSKESHGRNLKKTLRSVDMHSGLQEHQIAYLSHITFLTKGTGHMFIDLRHVVFLLFYSQDSLQPF